MALKPLIAGQFYNQPAASSPGGSSGQVQYNNDGAFGGLTGLTTAAGVLTNGTFAGGTVVASTPILNLSQTWNNAGVGFTGLLLNITNTASSTASMLMDLQVGGSSRFSVSADPNGGMIFNGAASGTYLNLQNAGNNRIKLADFSGSGSWIQLLTDNGTIQFGVSTDAGFTRAAAGIIKTTDGGSGFGFLQAKLRTEANAVTGLVAGALAALTTASIVIYDATGTAYRVPCITP